MRTLLLLLWLLGSINLLANTYNIVDFGAIPNDSKSDTEALQTAINLCSEHGGTVVVPPGVYDIGSVELRSNIHIRLEHGSVLSGSTKHEDYPEHQPTFASYTNTYQLSALFFAENASNIVIDGSGTIDGNGGDGDFYMTLDEWQHANNERKRPFVLLMRRCKDITISGITMKNSAFWMQQFLECENLRLENLDIINHANYNNDGLDINNCKDVIVKNCRIYCSDDAIVIKSTTGKISENIVISDCILRSHYNGFKIGTETNGGVRNVTLSNCVIGSPGYKNHHGPNDMGFCGIALQSNDGAIVENITISNVVIDSMMAPFFIRLQDRGRKISKDHERQKPGKMRNINISNVIATNVTALSSSITGIPGHYAENISFSNIQVYSLGGGTHEDIIKPVPEEEGTYPDVIMFDTNLPAFGFYVRHVKNISFNNIFLSTEQPDERYAFYLDDVYRYAIENVFFPEDCSVTKRVFTENSY